MKTLLIVLTKWSEHGVERVSQPLDGERSGHVERAVRERDAGRADAELDTLHALRRDDD